MNMTKLERLVIKSSLKELKAARRRLIKDISYGQWDSVVKTLNWIQDICKTLNQLSKGREV